ncbi:MAG TPA: malto-oligosyltrehalose trehalohydrolase [Actinomycetes bacterium]|jgi:maltooligosyltrehalose trehalohydrolase|nr:malto-oligosyltrehalose trehalohydrolase [Actinomycetes bacterium]
MPPGARRTPRLGPTLLDGGAELAVWAPEVASVAVRLGGRTVPLEREERGVWRGVVDGARSGDDYLLVLDGERERPDPRSLSQPQGPRGPSRLVDLGRRLDPPVPPALPELVFYELHCGTFTPEGTFDAAISRLPHLVDLGVTAVEVMPVAAFPGRRGWGYDGVDLYAVHAAYGGPAAFRRFVDACHARGLAVVLDVVYNHLGPDGNYLAEFGPYFTDRYSTPWGPALNYDGPGSDFVRDFVVDNAELWVAGYGVDGLRLDAVHDIYDRSSVHLLEALADRVHRCRPGSVVVAESDLNQPALVTCHGIDAQWADDLHHAVHVALTGEHDGYYRGFEGLGQLAKALTGGWVFTGQYHPALDRAHGREPAGLGGERFVVCSQNHDQVGNRPFGDRLASLAGPRLDAVASVLVACAPYLPLLFQGQEWGETRPFLYFTDHRPELADAVHHGRRSEFAAFAWSGQVPDPNDPATFERSKLDWAKVDAPAPEGLALPALELWRRLLRLRREVPALGNCRRDLARAWADEERRLVVLERGDPSGSRAVVVANLSAEPRPLPPGVLELPLLLATASNGSSEELPGQLPGHSSVVHGI